MSRAKYSHLARLQLDVMELEAVSSSSPRSPSSSSSPFPQNEEVAIACRAVATAAKLCAAVRSEASAPRAMTKSDRSPVTIADYGSQAIICDALSRAFPGDPVVAEEDAGDLRSPGEKDRLAEVADRVRAASGDPSVSEEDVANWIDHGNGSPSSVGRFWTLDPIDGTKGFLRGDQYAICLALIENGSVRLGIIGCPALEMEGTVGHLFVAKKGKGAWRKALNSSVDASMTRIRVNANIGSLVQSVEVSHGSHAAQQAVAKAVGVEKMLLMDSQAKYALVASGEAALYLRLSNYAENIWDHAAGVVLVEEASGMVSDRDGKPLDFTMPKMIENCGVIVTNGALHEKVLATLKDYYQ